LDGNKEVVNGAALQWSTNEPSVATVSSWGEVEAIAPGHTVATVQAGTGRATVAVEVRQGARPVQRDLEWDIEHSGDCGDPESSEPQSVGSMQEPPELTQAFTQSATGQLHSVAGDRSRSDYVRDDDVSEEPLNRDNASRRLPAEDSATLEENGGGRDTLRRLARRAAFRVTRSTNNGATRNASQKIPLGRLFPLIDPDGGDTTSPSAAKFNNAVGSPRFTAQDVSPTGSSKTRRQLGSYNYNFTAPVLGLGGRGNGVGLALSYNSRLWNKDNIGVNGQMTFNYNKGWPAAGWTLGYGRIIKNYDNTATGDGTGVGQFNHPGNRLLIQSDGTRVHLEQVYDSVGGTWDWDTTDGSFYHLSRNGKLKGPDGSIVKYDEPNNRLVPTSIKNRNGELITIAYRTKDVNFPYRWAIDFITDSLGRQFRYNAQTNQLEPVGNGTGGAPPGKNGGPQFTQAAPQQQQIQANIEEARKLGDQVGVNRDINQRIIQLAGQARTGPGTAWIHQAAAAAGLPSGASYQELGAFLDRQAAMAAHSMGLPETNLGVETAKQFTGNTQYNNSVILDKTKFVDALNTAAGAYRAGLDKAVGTGPNPNYNAYQGYRQAWAKNFDPEIFAYENAFRAGDKSEITRIEQDEGRRGMAELRQKRQALMRLVNGQ